MDVGDTWRNQWSLQPRSIATQPNHLNAAQRHLVDTVRSLRSVTSLSPLDRPPTSLAVVIGSRRRAFDSSSRLLLPLLSRDITTVDAHGGWLQSERWSLRCLVTRNRKESSTARFRLPFPTKHEINDKRTDHRASDPTSWPVRRRVRVSK